MPACSRESRHISQFVKVSHQHYVTTGDFAHHNLHVMICVLVPMHHLWLYKLLYYSMEIILLSFVVNLLNEGPSLIE